MSDPHPKFQQQVDEWILCHIKAGVITFDSLLLALPGVNPTEVLESLTRLCATGNASADLLTNALTLVRQPPQLIPGAVAKIPLPIPHPLDFDWRFSESANQLLWEKCLNMSDSGDTIVLLGCPSLFRFTVGRNLSRRIVLLDSSAEIYSCLSKHSSTHFSVHRCDLRTDSIPNLNAQVVIADPPWYQDFWDHFIFSASQIIRPMGKLLLSYPPLGTRPGITEEWSNTLSLILKLGFVVDEVERAALPYLLSPFERNALVAQGLANMPSEWRRGDLFTMTSKLRQDCCRPVTTVENSWAETSLQGVRIRVRSHESPTRRLIPVFPNPSLVSIIKDDVLPTVSRRDIRREAVDVWTSGNRVFACENPRILRLILSSLLDRKSPQSAVASFMGRKLKSDEIRMITATVQQLSSVVDTEIMENQFWENKWS